jgi:transposase
LVETLDREQKGWRKDTVLMMDGASYNKEEKVTDFLKRHGVNTCILSPYGYNLAPIEAFFAHFKQANLNNTFQKVGKK